MIKLLLHAMAGGIVGALILPALTILVGLAFAEPLLSLALSMVVPGFALGFFAGLLPGLRRRAKAQSGK